MSDETVAIAEEVIEETSESVAVTSIHDLKSKMKVAGKVQRLELYGAFIDLGIEATAILHISQLGKDRVNRVSDALDIGQEIEAWVDKVDPERGQVTLTMVEPLAVEWSDLKEGQVYNGAVVRLEKFGAFVDIGAEKEGLVHVSELSHNFVKHPSEVVKVGDEIEVKVLGFSKRKRRIDLSMKSLMESPEPEYRREPEVIEDFEDEVELPTAMEFALRQAMNASGAHFGHQEKGKKKSRRRRKPRAQQEDILHRTLKLSKES